ncbi:hypothetical protein F4775DRAFT_592689 [Biscogniauxia sp. FL1348]|nr:hypothetical protein F4775DRAFT_592689 [Biscogniauxia sp. FL1348]
MASQDEQQPTKSTMGRVPLPRRSRGSARASATANTATDPNTGASSSSATAVNPAAGAGSTAGSGSGAGGGAGSSTGTASTPGLAAAANPVAVGTGAGAGAGAGAAPPAASHANHGQVVRVGGEWRYECQCGSRVGNHRKNISSHMAKKHNPNSRYEQFYAAFANRVPCAEDGCDATFRNRYDIIHHYRRRHEHRGSSAPLLERYGFS